MKKHVASVATNVVVGMLCAVLARLLLHLFGPHALFASVTLAHATLTTTLYAIGTWAERRLASRRLARVVAARPASSVRFGGERPS